MPNPGDKVQVTAKKEMVKGILMPSPDEEIILLKLETGYNLGFEKKDVQEIKIIKVKEEPALQERKTLSPRSGLKTISLLHCGGTIASKVDYETGAVKAKFSPEELLEMFPELGAFANLRSRLIANLLSENIRFAHYNLIARAIEEEINSGARGIIVTHGTDTLHYTAAALSFALEKLNIPVLLVGAQRSSDRGSSDAYLNLACAVQFIANSDFSGVAICMHHSADDKQGVILPGVNSRKMHSSRRDAFKAINSEPFALIGLEGKITWLRKDYPPQQEGAKLVLKPFQEKIKVGLLKSHPQMFVEEFRPYLNFDGLVLEGTGLGHFPIEKYDSLTQENELIFKELEKLAGRIPLVMTVQTIFGGVNMNVYSPGRKLVSLGILGNGLNLTAETAFIKLAWLLSNYPPAKAKELMAKNLRGEINRQIGYKEDFVE